MDATVELEIGKTYRLVFKPGASGLAPVIPAAKFYALEIASNNVYELIFRYGNLRDAPQSIKVAPGMIFSFEELDTEASSE